MTPAPVGAVRSISIVVEDSPVYALPLVEARDRFHRTLLAGEDWYTSLLRAISYCDREGLLRGGYLVGGEALDLISLAGWFLKGVENYPPGAEGLLACGVPPRRLEPYEFRELIGLGYYQAYLNYCYGVSVEAGLILALRQEVRKEGIGSPYAVERVLTSEVSYRLYGKSKDELWQGFLLYKHLPSTKRLSLTLLKEFIYYAFKLRIKVSEKSKVASDTLKALEFLDKNGFRPSALSY